MAFYSNSTQGTVVHTTNGFYDHGKILANDGSDFANTTLATVSELSIPLGGYERIMGVYNIWYDSDDTNEFKFRVANVAQSDGSTAVATTIYTDVTARTEESTAADTPAAANIEGTGTYSTDGEGEVITVDVGAATSGLFLKVEFNALVTAATKGNLVFQGALITGTGSGTHLLAGSHVQYKKW
jgi:hypothetical protein